MAVPAWELGCGLTGVNLAQMPEIGVWSWAPPGGLLLSRTRAVLCHSMRLSALGEGSTVSLCSQETGFNFSLLSHFIV